MFVNMTSKMRNSFIQKVHFQRMGRGFQSKGCFSKQMIFKRL